MKIKSLGRNRTCPVCRGTGKIPIAGMTDEEIAREKKEALADIVEVVRCAKCKHLRVINGKELYAICAKTNLKFKPFDIDTRTHFCGYGERREQ